MRGVAAAIVLMLTAAPAAAQVTSAAPERASVTIYRSVLTDTTADRQNPSTGLAFVTETRTIDLPAGVSRIRFAGVADTMVPETAALQDLPGQLIERNEDFNLLSPGSLLAAYVGRDVRLVRTDPKTGRSTIRQATVRSGPDGTILEVDGGFEALKCSGLPERVIFPAAPEGLADRPTFSVLADVPQAGRYTVKLSYLATGFAWNADYVAKLDATGRSLDLSGWLTLTNNSAATFGNAPTDVVAGEVSRDGDTAPPEVEAQAAYPYCWPRAVKGAPRPAMVLQAPSVGYAAAPMGLDDVQEIVVTGSRIARQSDLGDYKLYTLPEPTTVAAHQTKQVRFLDQRNVPFERVYVARLEDPSDVDDDNNMLAPQVLLRLKNEAARGLGKALPSGNVAIMEPTEAGGLALAGEHRIKDTPVGLPLEIVAGQAMDVSVRVTARDLTPSDRGSERYRVEVEVANDKPVAITLEFAQANMGSSFKVAHASRRSGLRDGEPRWTVKLAPGERAAFNYEVSWTY